MDVDIKEMFKEKNKLILINSLQYDVEKNITSLLETITNIFNLEFDTAIKNIISIYEDGNYLDSNKSVTEIINKIKMSCFNEIDVLLEKKQIDLDNEISNIEFEKKHMEKYYEYVLSGTSKLKESFKTFCVNDIEDKAYNELAVIVEKNISKEYQERVLNRIKDYLFNRLYGKLETKIHMEVMLRDNNLINKAKEGYLRYQEICSKTEEK